MHELPSRLLFQHERGSPTYIRDPAKEIRLIYPFHGSMKKRLTLLISGVTDAQSLSEGAGGDLHLSRTELFRSSETWWLNDDFPVDCAIGRFCARRKLKLLKCMSTEILRKHDVTCLFGACATKCTVNGTNIIEANLFFYHF